MGAKIMGAPQSIQIPAKLVELVCEYYATSTRAELEAICKQAGYDLTVADMKRICSRHLLRKNPDVMARSKQQPEKQPNTLTGNHVERIGNRLIHTAL